MALISGEVSSNGRIYIINEDNNCVEHTELLSTGTYLIKYLPNGKKSITFRREDGKMEGFGNVDAYSLNIPGVMYGTGRNVGGQLGLNNTTDVSTLTMAGNDSDWKLVFGCGHSSIIIKENNTLWGCGTNTSSMLGIPVVASTLTQIGSDSNWSEVSGSTDHTLAIKTNGTLWVCGSNGGGQLGLNDRITRNTFTQVGSSDDYSTICGKLGSSYVIKKDGSLWSCGANHVGQLGLNVVSPRSTFTRIGADNNWKSISNGYSYHTLFIKSNGTLWGCGQNTAGQLGLNDRTNRSTLTQIGTDTDWMMCSVSFSSSVALKMDGTLWSCGASPNGLSGALRSTFTKVGSDDDWDFVICGSNFIATLKNDGTLWTCGTNNYGQLGLGDTVTTNVLTKVGENTWKKISCGDIHMLGIR